MAAGVRRPKAKVTSEFRCGSAVLFPCFMKLEEKSECGSKAVGAAAAAAAAAAATEMLFFAVDGNEPRVAVQLTTLPRQTRRAIKHGPRVTHAHAGTGDLC